MGNLCYSICGGSSGNIRSQGTLLRGEAGQAARLVSPNGEAEPQPATPKLAKRPLVRTVSGQHIDIDLCSVTTVGGAQGLIATQIGAQEHGVLIDRDDGRELSGSTHMSNLDTSELHACHVQRCARFLNGPLIDVDLEGVSLVRDARDRIAELLGRPCRSIVLVAQHGNELQDGDACGLELHVFTTESEAAAEPGVSPQPATMDISFLHAVTGESLSFAELDVDFSVRVAREVIAAAMGVDGVKLLDTEGNVLSDFDVLCELGIPEIKVCVIQKDRMSVEALRASFYDMNVSGATLTKCNGIYVADSISTDRTIYRNRDCSSAVISFEDDKWTLRLDGSVTYFCDSVSPPCDGNWIGTKDNSTCEVSHKGLEKWNDRTRSRLEKELFEMQNGGTDIVPGCTVELADSEVEDAIDHALLCWRITLPALEGTAYTGTIYEVLIRFPANYPFSPPEVWFVTEIEHWCVTATGKVVLDILQNQWSPAMTCRSIIGSVWSEVAQPPPTNM